MEEEEDEEDEEGEVDEYEEDEASGSNNYETTQQYQEDNNTQDNITSSHLTNNTFNFDDLDGNYYDNGTDLQEDVVRETNFDDGDSISEISISSPVLQWQPKHQLSDTESDAPSKWS